MKVKNRLIALLLCLCMAITLFPMTALAANTNDTARDVTFELAMASDLKGLECSRASEQMPTAAPIST